MGKTKDQPGLMMETHTDTVSNGVHFDGAFGVIVSLEVTRFLATGYTTKKIFSAV
ncbi:hypothetical protein [Lysinibacillus fusiformis]|uniref:hypothetical protein n=1 Tax=Lysinibacillus fusiformis TaxID=28031 RepID=UPI001782307E|nr:hypothetical protein [Lysinibacillus fusiformis]